MSFVDDLERLGEDEVRKRLINGGLGDPGSQNYSAAQEWLRGKEALKTDFMRKTKVELEWYVANFPSPHPFFKLAMAALIKKEEEETRERKSIDINIGSISGQQIQVGNQNTQTAISINVQELVEKVAASNDHEAKNLLTKLLENSTVGSIIGAGAASLLSLLMR